METTADYAFCHTAVSGSFIAAVCGSPSRSCKRDGLFYARPARAGFAHVGHLPRSPSPKNSETIGAPDSVTGS